MKETFTVRRFERNDAKDVLNVIHRGLREVNARDYSEKIIEDFCAYFSLEKIIAQAGSAHMYVAVSDDKKIVGTGSISSFWGSKTESILLTIYVLPKLVGKGVGTAIIKALEGDEYFLRARRIEVPSSVTAVGFYQKMGYVPKNGNNKPDDEGLIRLEKFR